MNQNDEVLAAPAGTSQDVDHSAAVGQGDGGNPVAQLQLQILELGQKHNQIISALANMSSVSTRSYVYIPRERQIIPFSGDAAKDGQTVDEFIDEIDCVIRVRGLNADDQVDFILSHLEGSALDEVKHCMGGDKATSRSVFIFEGSL